MIASSIATILAILTVLASQCHWLVTAQSDVEVIQFALAFEQLEAAFYEEGLDFLEQQLNSTDGNDTAVTEEVIARFTEIYEHEEAHVETLEQVLEEYGGETPEECTYNFTYETYDEFLTIAHHLENIGVSAYLGGIYLLTNKSLSTAASTIVTVEARHAAWLNWLNDLSPFPTAFDSPLDFMSVITLVYSWFGDNCSIPFGSHLSLEADPVSVAAGGILNITSDALSSDVNASEPVYCVFYASSASVNSTLEHDEGEENATVSSWFCRVPDDVYPGDNYLFLSKNEWYDLAHHEWVIAGPTIVHIEEQEEEGEDDDEGTEPEA